MSDKKIVFDDLLKIGEDEFIRAEIATHPIHGSALTINLNRSRLDYALFYPYSNEFSKDITTYQIDFETFFGVSAFQEQFAGTVFNADSNIYEGYHVRRYKKSDLYDSMDEFHQFDTFYADVTPVHYAFVNSFKQIDIISVTPPTVNEVHLKKCIVFE